MSTVTCRSGLGALLVAWREDNGVDVKEAAERAGVQPRTWQSWEAGSTPQLSAIAGLARVLGVRCSDLLVPEPECSDLTLEAPGGVAAALRSWRRREAMSLERAARRLGVAPSTVLDWEAGRAPRASQLRKLVVAGVLAD